MTYNTYVPDKIDSMFFRIFHIEPYVYNSKSYTLLEQLGQILEKVNEIIRENNDMGTAIVQFENYVLSQLQEYDQKIIDEVLKVINEKIADGTISELINNIFDEINQKIEVLEAKVDLNKQNIDISIDSINQSIDELNYKKGSLTLNTSPSQLIYNNGETINGVMLNVSVTKGTKEPTQLNFYKNSVLIHSKTGTINTSESFLDGNIVVSDTEYYVELIDGATIVQSEKIIIKFVNNIYTGLINGNDIINETLIKSLTPHKIIKSDINEILSPNEQKILYACPASYGFLNSALDSAGTNFIDSMTYSVVNIVINGVQVPYNVMVSSDTILDYNLNVTFKF